MKRPSRRLSRNAPAGMERKVGLRLLYSQLVGFLLLRLRGLGTDLFSNACAAGNRLRLVLAVREWRFARPQLQQRWARRLRRQREAESCGHPEICAGECREFQVCPPCACYPSTGDTIDSTDCVSSFLSVSALFKRGV